MLGILELVDVHPPCNAPRERVPFIGGKIVSIASLPGFIMAFEEHVSYSLGPNIRTRKARPCLVRVHIDPIPPKGLQRLQTCHRQRSSPIVATTSGNRVHAVVTLPIGTSSPSGHCTT